MAWDRMNHGGCVLCWGRLAAVSLSFFLFLLIFYPLSLCLCRLILHLFRLTLYLSLFLQLTHRQSSFYSPLRPSPPLSPFFLSLSLCLSRLTVLSSCTESLISLPFSSLFLPPLLVSHSRQDSSCLQETAVPRTRTRVRACVSAVAAGGKEGQQVDTRIRVSNNTGTRQRDGYVRVRTRHSFFRPGDKHRSLYLNYCYSRGSSNLRVVHFAANGGFRVRCA